MSNLIDEFEAIATERELRAQLAAYVEAERRVEAALLAAYEAGDAARATALERDYEFRSLEVDHAVAAVRRASGLRAEPERARR